MKWYHVALATLGVLIAIERSPCLPSFSHQLGTVPGCR